MKINLINNLMYKMKVMKMNKFLILTSLYLINLNPNKKIEESINLKKNSDKNQIFKIYF